MYRHTSMGTQGSRRVRLDIAPEYVQIPSSLTMLVMLNDVLHTVSIIGFCGTLDLLSLHVTFLFGHLDLEMLSSTWKRWKLKLKKVDVHVYLYLKLSTEF